MNDPKGIKPVAKKLATWMVGIQGALVGVALVHRATVIWDYSVVPACFSTSASSF